MTFETYRDSIIEDFIEDCVSVASLEKGQGLTDHQIKEINERFEEHRECFEKGYENAKDEAMELITSCIYAGISASIECMECSTVIIDDEILFHGEQD